MKTEETNSTTENQKEQSIQPEIEKQTNNHQIVVAKIEKENLPELPPPPLPPNKLDSYPRIITQIPSSQSTSSNQKLIKFLYGLSNLIFFGGSLAGLLVLIYQKYIFPKLKIRTEKLKLLYLTGLNSHLKISEKLNELVQINSNLFKLSFIKVFKNNNNSIDYNQDQETKKPNSDLTENDEQAQTESFSNAGSTSENSTEEKKKETNPTRTSTNVSLDRSLRKYDSNSSSFTSDHELPIRSEDQNEGKLNEPIIQYLERITKKLKKREEIREEKNNESIELEDIMSSKDLKITTTKMKASSISIRKLKESIKAIEHELDHQSEQITLINQKLSSPPHVYSYGLNQWSTYSNSRQSIDADPYFIALNQFKSHIRELKGTLLNRKKFY